MTRPPDDRIAWLLRPDHPEWLRQGAIAWLGGGDSLHRCLNLDRAAHVRAVRDYHLVEAWMALPGPAGWPGALALSDEIRKFAGRVWPRLSDLSAPDPAWSRLRRELWLAFRVAGAAKFPDSPDFIRKIVDSAGVYHQRDQADNRG